MTASNTAIQSPFNLNGRHALVTGSSKGIGRDIALGLAKAGAKVTVHDQTDNDALEDVTQSLKKMDKFGSKMTFDLSDHLAIEKSVSDVLKTESIDVLILNASFEVREPIFEVSTDNIRKQFEVNFLGNIILCNYLIPRMVENKWGRIIGLGSIQESYTNLTLAPYAALKSAQTRYLKSLAVAVASDGVTVNTIAPGAIETDRNRNVLSDEAVRESVLGRIPSRRIGQASDCVGSAVFLASDEASYITGAWLPVDGGFHLS